ncbi:helix-turn-helix domain-containing protein [Streptomyces sp. SCUT-3]|uniref:helix-turn-helix domain-containing protein n=1 Tax=Streptomyces TaxID=1883 RepID=UPI000CCA6E84|nr:helix-turn-helix transcriptional regulator [Streptomyces sp. SCUT-3]PLW69299.1 transcriptional regulator [Streptomyces sp. DJ]QMV21354.1 helix-turn-helix domain-containing protein [Streptomyces sp. SCUT-3]
MGSRNDAGSTTLKYFGSQLKLLRGRAGLSRAELGERVGYSEAMVAAVEQGRRIPQQGFVDQADEALDARGVLRIGASFLAQARYPSWFQDFAILEADAVSMYLYSNQTVPGVLQTEEYARAVVGGSCPPPDDDEVERRVAARLDRQTLLTRTPRPVLGFVIEEVVVRRPIGGSAVMEGQLRRLLDCARMRNVSLQVMPTCRETHAGLEGPMVLLETQDRRNLAYVEGQRGSFLISEQDEVSVLMQRYGILRAQALSPEESASLIEQVLGEL